MNDNSSTNPNETTRENDTVIDPGSTSNQPHSTKGDSTMNEHETTTTTTQETSPKTSRSWSTRTVAVGGIVAVLLGLGAGAALGATTGGDDDESHFGPGISRGDHGPGQKGQGPGQGDMGYGQQGEGQQAPGQDGWGGMGHDHRGPHGDGQGMGDCPGMDGEPGQLPGQQDGGPDSDGSKADQSAV